MHIDMNQAGQIIGAVFVGVSVIAHLWTKAVQVGLLKDSKARQVIADAVAYAQQKREEWAETNKTMTSDGAKAIAREYIQRAGIEQPSEQVIAAAVRQLKAARK